MALQLTLSKRQMIVLKNLGRNMEWEDLSFEDKLRAYESGINLTDEVDPEKIKQFERELKMKEMKAKQKKVGSVIKRLTRMVTN